jgi:hypothetical protein
LIKDYLFSTYGCYPPWVDDSEGKQCEDDILPKELQSNVQGDVKTNIWFLLAGIDIELMKQCMPPCYQVQGYCIEVNN